ncbi:hypothetical protein SAMD00079811_11970 [Scytonema sp. HK-05]|uniref:hypothetical protein n=1 Tax=Scytonema sp. HK-05 TaxID=1137095 RepID=UPI0009358D2D|nr:hypothetical protein [Scytonema sp. HK-05]OKH60240.1 hypothetical protein NIES2130_03985 [Scytonema sp. HK-05]BAY43617.1 hypothetical protein SAMD00079811_11970 [Scytonema sp. HK-05]
MIISFNPIVFQSQDAEIQAALAKILIALMNANLHFIDIKSIDAIFYNEKREYIFDSNVISTTYLSPNDRRGLKEFLNKKSQKPITSLHKQHLSHIVIGLDKNNKEIHPSHAYKIITQRSKVIVENGINDWKFIKGICHKYSSGKTKRRSIYQLLNQAIKDEIIESDNCGGVGEITKIAQRWIDNDRYKNIFKYKLMAIFDSDKKFQMDVTPHKNKIEYFKSKTITIIQDIDYRHEPTDFLAWHILYKIKIENYIPLNILFENITSITQAQKTDLESKTNDDLDFIEYNQNNIGIGKSEIKDKFPKMFLAPFSYRDFEQRCEHHKVFLAEANESVSEIEQILLKMAKII